MSRRNTLVYYLSLEAGLSFWSMLVEDVTPDQEEFLTLRYYYSH